MKKLISILIIVLFIFQLVHGQTKISGTVSDAETGEPLIGVTVVIKNSSSGTTSGENGDYELIVPKEHDTVDFSFMGYESKEIVINERININVELVRISKGLNEVVVIGYGTQKKKDLTGSISSVNTKESFATPTTNVGQALQGRASGVYATSMNGAPGTGTTIRIRGGNSITAGNEPLYVIDGVIGGGNLTLLNPDDIESIQILKDASATAIYGARGANGVIVITTKRGKNTNGKPIITVKSSGGIQKIAERIKVQSPKEFAIYENEGAEMHSVPPPYDINNLPSGTDWQKAGTRRAIISKNTVSLSTGSEKTQVYLSGGYFYQEGVLISNSFKRYNLRANLNQEISDFLHIGVKLNYSRSNTDNPKFGYGALVSANPLINIFDKDGKYTGTQPDNPIFLNPIGQAAMRTDNSIKNRFLENAYIKIDFLKAFSFKTSLGTDLSLNYHTIYNPGIMPWREAQEQGGEGSINNTRASDVQLNNILNFNPQFQGKSDFNAMVGFLIESTNTKSSFLSGSHLSNDATKFYALQLAEPEHRDISSGYTETKILSFIGRINYVYNQKYLITASFRRDGSSKFGKNNRWANFPSIAFAWRLSNEPFMEEVNFVDNLKLRASFGVTGNQGIGPFATLARLGNNMGILNGQSVLGVVQGTFENPNVKWETTNEFDFGLNAGLFENRLNFDLDFYYKKTKDLLFNIEIPHFTGFHTQLKNIGTLRNTGFDFSVKGVVINKRNFSWLASLNISHYNNKILDLGALKEIPGYRLPPISRSLSGKIVVGKPLGIFYGYVFDKINPETGDAEFKDINNDDQIDDEDRTEIGNSNPTIYGGIQNTFRYKNFELGFFFYGSLGNDLYNTRLFNANALGSQDGANSYAVVRKNVWLPQKTEGAKYPGPGIRENFLNSNSAFVRDGSYLRLRTLRLSYSLPTKRLKDSFFKEVSFSLIGRNLFIIKDKSVLNGDPELSQFGRDDIFRGYSNVVYPMQRSYSFEINIKF